jgi:hypothetical protein
MKTVLIALLVLVALRIGVRRLRQFADPDPSLYGQPNRRA